MLDRVEREFFGEGETAECGGKGTSVERYVGQAA